MIFFHSLKKPNSNHLLFHPSLFVSFDWKVMIDMQILHAPPLIAEYDISWEL